MQTKQCSLSAAVFHSRRFRNGIGMFRTPTEPGMSLLMGHLHSTTVYRLPTSSLSSIGLPSSTTCQRSTGQSV